MKSILYERAGSSDSGMDDARQISRLEGPARRLLREPKSGFDQSV